MYSRILAALDGSIRASYAMDAATALAKQSDRCTLIGCHVYAALLHQIRFEDMEPGLPARYQEEERLAHLRDAHDDIIGGGMKVISDAYLVPFAEKAHEMNIAYEGITPEGRNYVQLLRAARERAVDVIVLGATGHGTVPEATLGSTAERTVLYAHDHDVLIVRRPWKLKGHPIIVGIDGSDNSYVALKRATEIAQAQNATVEAVSVYDPFFHTGVFGTIERALPEEAKKRFRFAAQEQLHDEIIDQGLMQLYGESLERGVKMAESLGTEMRSEVLAGKVYPQIHHYATLRDAGLVVVGRWGIHKEPESLIGSHTLNLARLSFTNLLVVAPGSKPISVPQVRSEAPALTWTAEARAYTERIPSHVRPIATRMIEIYARRQKRSQIDLDMVQEVAKKRGVVK